MPSQSSIRESISVTSQPSSFPARALVTAVLTALTVDYFQGEVLHTTWPERPIIDATFATVANYIRGIIENRMKNPKKNLF